jgi:hypothetical protein
LDNLLRRLPRVVRQLRSRYSDRPAFRIQDVHDLEDLLRALLPLHFDEVRPECRTPRYSAATRTDFWLPAEQIAVTCKHVSRDLGESHLVDHLQEDAAYYRGRCRSLVVLVYDAEQRLHEPGRLEAAWRQAEEELEVRSIIAR